MKEKIFAAFFILLFFISATFAQQTFETTKLLNTHTVESLKTGFLDFRITHRFDDMFPNWSAIDAYHNYIGFDNSSDIRIAFEVGITEDLMVGYGRSKGAGDFREVHDLFGKYKILKQDEKMPVTISVVQNTNLTGMRRNEEDPTVITNLPKFVHRFSYLTQILVARKFSDRLSLQITPTYLHRNFVLFDDENDLFAIGIAGKVQISKVTSLIFDAQYPFSNFRSVTNKGKYFFPVGLGLEFKSGKHVFDINFTNARAINENDYLTTTKSDWFNGEFRFGFTISRLFKIF